MYSYMYVSTIATPYVTIVSYISTMSLLCFSYLLCNHSASIGDHSPYGNPMFNYVLTSYFTMEILCPTYVFNGIVKAQRTIGTMVYYGLSQVFPILYPMLYPRFFLYFTLCITLGFSYTSPYGLSQVLSYGMAYGMAQG